MKRPLIWVLVAVLLMTACSAAPRTETELRTWAIERYKKMDGHDPDALQLKIADKFAENAAATEKGMGKRLNDDQLAMLLADVGRDVALGPRNR
jgi:hypothetical protein